jgi:crotonobetainyl-CoA:carnitine CoA-transferase CaiB-like acyl-CoA transferase
MAPDSPIPAAGALSGIRVIDFSRFMPGPFAAWLLADYGADVIRIETPRETAKQDQLQRDHSAKTAASRRRARAAQTYARNKRSLLIDPTHERGREVIMKLIASADVLVEDYRPGVMAAMGYGYEPLSAANPRLVYCSVSFAGQTGPYSARAGHDPLALALAGTLSILSNTPRPLLPNVPISDVVTGCLAAFGILTALRARDTTGRGQLVDAAMSDAATVMVGTALWRNDGDRHVGMPGGEWSTKGGVWECADGRFLCTTDMEPRFWQRFCAAIGCKEYAALQAARSRWPEMHARISQIIGSRPLAHWTQVLGAADTQWMPVYTPAEAFSDPHNVARGLPLSLPVGDGTSVDQFAPPIRLSATPGRVRHVATPAGAHNDELLRELGYDAAAIAALKSASVVSD